MDWGSGRLRVWDAIGRPVMEYGAEATRTGERGNVDATGSKVDGCEEKHEPGGNPGELGMWRIKGRWDLARLRLWRKLVEGKNVLASWVYRQSRLEFEQGGKDRHGQLVLVHLAGPQEHG